MQQKKKLIRTSTVPLSLNVFCRGLLRDLSDEYEVLAVSSPGDDLQEIAAREGVRTVAIPMPRRMAPGKDLVSLVRLCRLFSHEKPDLVHSITPKAGLLSMLAARLAGVPVRLHTFTGLLFPYAGGWKRRVLKLTDRLTAACATHIVPEGEGVKADLLAAGITDKPLEVLGYGNLRGIDLVHYDRTPDVLAEAERIRNRFGIGPKDSVFLFVGRIVRDKGIVELAGAFLRLCEEGLPVHLLLCGCEEPETDPLPGTTRTRMAECSRIHVSQGWLDDVRPWYAAADALVHPSWREGFPNVVIEAGAMGLPAIVTDINGSREIILPEENGVIVPPRNEDALYAQMLRFATRPEERERMATCAREKVAGRYEQHFVQDCLKAYYHKILS